MKRYLHDIIVAQTVSVFASVLVAAVAMNITDLKAAGYPDRNPDGSINTGNASIFTVLTNGDFNASDSSFVKGNVGVGGNGNFNESGTAQVNGDLYMNNNGHINISGQAKVTGQKRLSQSTLLNKAWADVTSLSNAAKAEPTTPAYMSLTSVNLDHGANITITGGASQKIVLNLQNFQLNNSSTFTLQGTATTTFIINVTNNFSLDNSSKIVLGPGVQVANILFNVLNSDAHINHGSQVFGTILDLNHKVQVSDKDSHGVFSNVTGRVFAKQVELNGGGNVVTPVTNR